MNYPAYDDILYILGRKGDYHLWAFLDPDSEGVEFNFDSTNSDDK
jgi:hypothetical protein